MYQRLDGENYFLSLTTGVTTVASHMIALVAARNNHTTACRRLVQVCVNFGTVTGEVTFLQKIYRGTSAFLCGVSFISFVESQFLVRKLQHFLVMHAWCVSWNKGRQRSMAW